MDYEYIYLLISWVEPCSIGSSAGQKHHSHGETKKINHIASAGLIASLYRRRFPRDKFGSSFPRFILLGNLPLKFVVSIFGVRLIPLCLRRALRFLHLLWGFHFSRKIDSSLLALWVFSALSHSHLYGSCFFSTSTFVCLLLSLFF